MAYDSNTPNFKSKNSTILIKSDYVICPTCKKSAILEEKDFKLIIYGYQNEHITNNILSNILCFNISYHILLIMI